MRRCTSSPTRCPPIGRWRSRAATSGSTPPSPSPRWTPPGSRPAKRPAAGSGAGRLAGPFPAAGKRADHPRRRAQPRRRPPPRAHLARGIRRPPPRHGHRSASCATRTCRPSAARWNPSPRVSSPCPHAAPAPPRPKNSSTPSPTPRRGSRRAPCRRASPPRWTEARAWPEPILVTGSFFLVGEALALLTGQNRAGSQLAMNRFAVGWSLYL